MRIPPIFAQAASSPEPPLEPGIFIAEPHARRAQTTWLHGILAIEDEGLPCSNWLRALFVTATTERGCQPLASNLTRGRTYFAPPAWVDSGFGLLYLPFHLELFSTLPFPLQPEAIWLQVAAREHASAPLRLPQDAFGKEPEPQTEVDALVTAYTSFAEGDALTATAHFEAAFAREQLRADLDSGHLYAAACAAAQAIPVKDPEESVAAQRALAWLAEDMQRCAKRLSHIAVQLVACEETAVEALVAEQAALSRHLAGIRHEPLLAPVRNLPAYRSLF